MEMDHRRLTGTPVSPHTEAEDEAVLVAVRKQLKGVNSTQQAYSFLNHDVDTLTVTFDDQEEQINWRLLDSLADSEDVERSLFIAVMSISGPKTILKDQPTTEVLYTHLRGDDDSHFGIKIGFLSDGEVVISERYPFDEEQIRTFDPRCIAALLAWHDRDDCENEHEGEKMPAAKADILPFPQPDQDEEIEEIGNIFTEEAEHDPSWGMDRAEFSALLKAHHAALNPVLAKSK